MSAQGSSMRGPSESATDQPVSPATYLAGCLVFLCLGALSLVVYRPALGGWFVLDDQLWLDQVAWPDLARWFTGSWGHGVAYRPIVRLSFAIDQRLFGDGAIGWHAHSLLIHVLNATLVWAISRRVSRADVASFLVAVLFLCSPLLDANINWISARTHSFGALFVLLAAWFFMRRQRRRGSARREAPALTAYVLAMMCYESMAVFPLLLILFEMARRRRISWAETRRIVVSMWPYGLVLTGFSLVRQWFLAGQFVDVVGYAPSLLRGAVANYGTMGRWLVELHVWLVPALVLFVVISLWLRRWLIVAWLAALVAVYAPYAPANDATPRFAYLLVPIMISVPVLYVARFVESKHKLLLAGYYSYLAVAGAGLAWEAHGRSANWREAGLIARGIVEQVHEAFPRYPRGRDLVFCGIPGGYRNAGVFVTYLDKAIARGHGGLGGRVIWDQTLLDDPRIRRKIGPEDVFFRYELSTRTLHQVDFVQWSESGCGRSGMNNGLAAWR